jgi:hypothetical protein
VTLAAFSPVQGCALQAVGIALFAAVAHFQLFRFTRLMETKEVVAEAADAFVQGAEGVGVPEGARAFGEIASRSDDEGSGGAEAVAYTFLHRPLSALVFSSAALAILKVVANLLGVGAGALLLPAWRLTMIGCLGWASSLYSGVAIKRAAASHPKQVC